MAGWPACSEDLIRTQAALGALRPELWQPPPAPKPAGGCFVCFPRHKSGPGASGDPGWAAAALVPHGHAATVAVVQGQAGAAYEPGLLALREGPLLEAAVRALPEAPEILLVNATGRDHPRRAGLALHLGAILDLPTVGVTHRPLFAEGEWPVDERSASAPLRLDGEVVACWLRTRPGTRPLVAHPAWRTDLDAAAELVLAQSARFRTPEPIRRARQAARRARAQAG